MEVVPISDAFPYWPQQRLLSSLLSREEFQGIFPGSEAERRSADGLENGVLPSGPLKRFLWRLVLKSVLDREKS